mmetsp:Transcript_5440/g.16211  ORF Transcript_5440/g.16211 Transcript_5440/m.16211 type:complete len:172 (+) Transcript_5440:39-554(+)
MGRSDQQQLAMASPPPLPGVIRQDTDAHEDRPMALAAIDCSESYQTFRDSLNLGSSDYAVPMNVIVHTKSEVPLACSPAIRTCYDEEPEIEIQALHEGTTRDVFDAIALHSDNFMDPVSHRGDSIAEAHAVESSEALTVSDAPACDVATPDHVSPFTEGEDEESVLRLLPD